MPAVLISIVMGLTGFLPPSGETRSEYLTLDGGILCRIPENVEIANEPAVAKSETVLLAMGCLRVQAGIRSRVLNHAVPREPGDAWQVLIYDRGIPFTILWGLP